MSKRIASRELTHENWAEEEEAEEMGTFRQASSDQLSERQIKKARRRGGLTDDSPSVFKGLTGFTAFGGNKDSSTQPTFSFLSKAPTSESTTKLSFDFLSKSNSSTTTNSVASKAESNAPEKKTPSQSFRFTQSVATPKTIDSTKTNGIGPAKANAESSNKGSSTLFLAYLKALNEGLLIWVKKHLDENPHVNLSPVFDDYKKHFDELSKKYPPAAGSESDSEIGTGTGGSSKTDEGCEKENKPLTTDHKSKEVTVSMGFPFSGSFTGTAEKTSEVSKPLFSFGSSTASTETGKEAGESNTKPNFKFEGFDSGNKSEGLTFPKTSNTGFFFGGKGSSESSSLTSGFSFSSSNTSSTTTATTTVPAAGDSQPDEPVDEPPKVEVKEVKEDDALYEKKCKLFYMKDGSYIEKGVGTLFLKPAGEKTQLLIRALTNLGNILLNIVLNATIPAVRAGKNGVIIACVPNPPLDGKSESSEPVKMLIRVKTTEDADTLLEKINELKK